MPTTSNFGWTTPADTDLVKDGAAAIRTLGNGIDTSLVDLKGGTTGQILSKNSNTDLDYTWVTPNVGDITEVQAGVGISVSSGTGPIPIVTNSSTDLITTAGDILYGTAADTVARLGIGTAGQVLTVNSGATAPEWKTSSSTATFVGCSIYKTSTQSLSNGAYAAITYDSEEYDTDGFHSTSSNTDRITIPSGKGGYYLFSGVLSYDPNGTGRRIAYLEKNGTGTLHYPFISNVASTGNFTFTFSAIIKLIAGDYIKLQAYQDSGGSLNIQGNLESTRFSCVLLGV